MSLQKLEPEDFFAKLEALQVEADEIIIDHSVPFDDTIAVRDVFQSIVTVLAHTKPIEAVDLNSLSTDEIRTIVFPVRLQIRLMGSTHLREFTTTISRLQSSDFTYTDEQANLMSAMKNKVNYFPVPDDLTRRIWIEIKDVLGQALVSNGIKLLPLVEEAGFDETKAYNRAGTKIYPEVTQPAIN